MEDKMKNKNILKALLPITIMLFTATALTADEYEFEYDIYEYLNQKGKEQLGETYTYSGLIEYDQKGNEIHTKTTYSEYWYDYNAAGKVTHSKSASGTETWYEYDKKGNLIHEKDTLGIECWYKYKSKGKKVEKKTTYGENWVYDCDSKGNYIYGKNSDGFEVFFERDSNGNVIHYHDSDIGEYWDEYDSTGKLIRSRNNVDDSETTYDYDPKGNLIHKGSDQGYDCWYSYTFWENGKPKTRKEYSIQRDVDF